MAQSKPQWLYEIDEFKDSKNIKVHVHTIIMGDVDDPEIYVAQPIYEWQQTEKGRWIMDHSMPEPSYHSFIDHLRFGFTFHICAYLNEKDYTFYRLKYE